MRVLGAHRWLGETRGQTLPGRPEHEPYRGDDSGKADTQQDRADEIDDDARVVRPRKRDDASIALNPHAGRSLRREKPGGGCTAITIDLGAPRPANSGGTPTARGADVDAKTTSAAPMAVTVRAAIAATVITRLESLAVKRGGGMTPRSAAQEAANERGSDAPLPSTSSAEAPSASACFRSAVRSAAISLATESGTRSRFHSRWHRSTKSFTLLPPLRRGPTRHRQHRAQPAIQTRHPREHIARRG